ncbi:hypothetical protein RUND412_008272 [Rhizina undulata]
MNALLTCPVLVVDVDIWVSAEISITIVCSCCPSLKMLFMHYFCKPKPETQQNLPEDAINLDHIPFRRAPRILGTSPKESMVDFIYDPSQAGLGSAPSSQLHFRALPDLPCFGDGSCSVFPDAGDNINCAEGGRSNILRERQGDGEELV